MQGHRVYVRSTDRNILAILLGCADTFADGGNSFVHVHHLQTTYVQGLRVPGSGHWCVQFKTIHIFAHPHEIQYCHPGIGWLISSVGIAQLPIWAVVAIIKQPGSTFVEKVQGAFRPMADWGPIDPATYDRYKKLRSTIDSEDQHKSQNIFKRFKRNIFG